MVTSSLPSPASTSSLLTIFGAVATVGVSAVGNTSGGVGGGKTARRTAPNQEEATLPLLLMIYAKCATTIGVIISAKKKERKRLEATQNNVYALVSHVEIAMKKKSPNASIHGVTAVPLPLPLDLLLAPRLSIVAQRQLVSCHNDRSYFQLNYRLVFHHFRLSTQRLVQTSFFPFLLQVSPSLSTLFFPRRLLHPLCFK